MTDLPPIHPVPADAAFLRATVGEGARTVLEIGANRGMHTPMLLHAFPEAHVHAFEPDPRACDHFRAAIRDRRVTLHQMALGAENGRIEFHSSGGQPPAGFPGSRDDYRKGWDQSGSIRKPKKHLELFPWCKFVRTISVEARTLDTWSRKHAPGTIDFIWADVQGAERDLVRGGAEALRRTRFLYTEYSDDELYEGQATFRELLALLPDFEIVRRYHDDVLLRNTAFGRA